MSYDTWKTTDPDDATLGRADGLPSKFRCLDCDWTGKGYHERARHFDTTRGSHRLVWFLDPRPSPAKQEVA